MSDDESARMDALAQHYSLTSAGVIRMLVKRDADAIGFVVAPKAAKPPKRAAKKRA